MSDQPSLGRRITAEILGTFLFVFVGAGSAVASYYLGIADPGSGILVAAFANGLGLATAISATMAVSGGHLNPAVTVGLFLGKKIHRREVLPYIVAQLVGASIAGIVLILASPSFTGGSPAATEGHFGGPTLNVITVGQGIVFEMVMTFLLVLTVYGTIVDKRAPKIGGFGVGLIVLADVLAGGYFTGAAMNPARAMGPMIASLSFPSYWYIYWIGPVIGGALAGIIYSRILESQSAD